MIPGLISWQYKRINNKESATYSVCCKVCIADNDVILKDFIEKDLNDYMMFVCCIGKHEELENDVISTILITEENIDDNQYVPKGCYYCTYLCPSYYPINSSGLKIQDILNDNKQICLEYPYVFNKEFCCRSLLPTNTFIFN